MGDMRRRVRSSSKVSAQGGDDTGMFVFNWYAKLALIFRDESIE